MFRWLKIPAQAWEWKMPNPISDAYLNDDENRAMALRMVEQRDRWRALADDLAPPLAWMADHGYGVPPEVMAAANAALARYRKARQQ
jgi:hypothetical protein